jgi:hypothetical protein
MLKAITTREGKTLRKFAGISLLVIGAIVLLGHFGPIFLLALLGGLAFVGAKKLKHATTKKEKNIAYLYLGLAAVVCLFNVPFLFAILVGGALIYFGYQILQPQSTRFAGTSEPRRTFENSFDADWQAFVDKKKNN